MLREIHDQEQQSTGYCFRLCIGLPLPIMRMSKVQDTSFWILMINVNVMQSLSSGITHLFEPQHSRRVRN